MTYSSYWHCLPRNRAQLTCATCYSGVSRLRRCGLRAGTGRPEVSSCGRTWVHTTAVAGMRMRKRSRSKRTLTVAGVSHIIDIARALFGVVVIVWRSGHLVVGGFRIFRHRLAG